MINFPIIQVAGISSIKEAEMLVESGIRWLGFPFRLDHHKEDTSEEEAKKIIASLPDEVNAVLITYLRSAGEAAELGKYLGAKAVQIHGSMEIGEMKKLRMMWPEVLIIKSIVIKGNDSAEAIGLMRRYEPFADAFITDTYDSETGASGATGKIHNWDISRQIVQLSTKPVILAGGLNPGNVGEGIKKVKPAGVDCHTGVENSSGFKDRALVKAFILETEKAYSTLSYTA